MAHRAKKATQFAQKYSDRLHDPAWDAEPDELEGILREARLLLYGADQEGQRQLWATIGIVQNRLKDFEGALEAARMTHALASLDPLATNNVGHALGKLGRVEEALQCFLDAEKLAERDPSAARLAQMNQAVAHFQLGDRTAAFEALRRARRINLPMDAAEQFGLAVTTAQLGLPDDAVEYVARSLCQRAGEPRGDSPALELIDRLAPGHINLAALSPSIVEAIAIVRAREAEDVPEEMATPARITLSPAGWARFAELVEA